MGFADDIQAFSAKVAQRHKDVFVGSATAVKKSITDGSEITAAPGQPVRDGILKGSWQLTYPEDMVGLIATGVEYAEPIEEGMGPHGSLTLRSEVGGFHSVALTRAGWPALVDDVVKRVVPDV